MKNETRDEIISAALEALPDEQRRAVDEAAVKLAEQIGHKPGGRHFGFVRARELIVALALFENRINATAL